MNNEGIKFDSIVICSTLNQMVNYVVIKQHDIKRIYNLTEKCNSTRFKQNKWNENLRNILDESYKITDWIYNEGSANNNQNIVDIFLTKKLNKDEKILWNITGGQRHVIMAIINYVSRERPNDVIVYFEGDKEKMYYYSSENEPINEKCFYKTYNYDMSIKIALKLMGFETEFKLTANDSDYYKTTSKYYKFIMSNNEEEFNKLCDEDKEDKTQCDYKKIDKQYDWYNKFYDIYIESEKLRDVLILSNRYKSENNKKNNRDEENKDGKKNKSNKKSENDKENMLHRLIEEIKENLNKIKKEVCPYINEEDIDKILQHDIEDVLDESLKKYKNGKVFGYILERMTFYKIIYDFKHGELEKKNLADIDISVKTVDKKNTDTEKLMDEFDILIVTRYGKVIMLECKSGGMTGDNAKSHNYSTYAIAGVYGAPILVSPVDESELMKNKKKDDTYKYIISARSSAEKANLKIWEANKKEILSDLIKEK